MSKKIEELEIMKELLQAIFDSIDVNSTLVPEQLQRKVIFIANNHQKTYNGFKKPFQAALEYIELLQEPNYDPEICDHDYVMGPYSKDEDHQYCLKCGELK